MCVVMVSHRSDDLAKSCTVTEQVVSKIKRQVGETGGPAAMGQLKVDGQSPEVYLTRFKWDEAKFPTRRPLRETVDKIMEVVGRIEDDLKVRDVSRARWHRHTKSQHANRRSAVAALQAAARAPTPQQQANCAQRLESAQRGG